MFSAFSGSKSPTFTPAPVAPMLPETLEKKDGTTVNTKEALAGKIVALYFSSSWCGACLRMTPILHAMHEEAVDEDKPFEVVFVSSDDSDAEMKSYHRNHHGDWLRIAYGDKVRNELKRYHGAFAGAEARLFPGAKRLSGIPTVLLVGPNGEKLQHLDCDGGPGKRLIQSKGAQLVDEWVAKGWAWPRSEAAKASSPNSSSDSFLTAAAERSRDAAVAAAK